MAATNSLFNKMKMALRKPKVPTNAMAQYTGLRNSSTESAPITESTANM